VLTLILIISFYEHRGLAAVHSYDSTLCHRDVKSFNFLGKLCRLLAPGVDPRMFACSFVSVLSGRFPHTTLWYQL
jgi:hypothetical protein